MQWIIDNLGLIGTLTVDHIRQSLIAIVLGFVLALPIGWVAFRYTALRGPVLSVVGILYTLPSLGLFAVIATLLGISPISELNLVIALTIYAVALMTRSVTDAFISVDPDARSAATAIGFGSFRRIFAVELPLAIPVLLSGLRVTAVSTIALTTVGILIGVDNLGYLFTNGADRQIVEEVLAGVVVVALLSFIADRLLVLLSRVLAPWSVTKKPAKAKKEKVAA